MNRNKKIHTSGLSDYIFELKEVMHQKGYSNYQIQTYNKIWKTLLTYTSDYPNQEFTENFRQQFVQDVFAEALENRDAMYRITRAVNMLSDYVQFHVVFRQYCTSKTDFSEELKEIFLEFIKEETQRNFTKSTINSLRVRLLRFHDYLYDTGIRDF